MAARRRAQSENEDELEAGTLRAEVLRALRRLVLAEGSIAAAARILVVISPSLRLSRQRLSRWLKEGVPASALEGDALSALLFAIYTRFAQLDRDQPARDARELRIKRSLAAEEILRTFGNKRERKRLISTIRGWCRRHHEIAKFRGLKESGVQIFADELRVRAELLREAIRPGEEAMSVKLFQAFKEFEKREAAQAEEDAIDRRKMDELMELARVPATTTRMEPRVRRVREGGRWVRRRVMVAVEYQEPVLPKIPSGSWEFSGEGTHGRRWGMPIGKYLLPRIDPSGNDGWKTIEKFVAFALSVPGLEPAHRYPEWNVTALASSLGESEVGSKQQFRELGHPDSNRFIVAEAYSGGNRRPPRARERTISCRETPTEKRGFIQHIGAGMELMDVIFLHGGYAWNFRRRSEEERKRIEKARKENYELQKTLEKVKARVVEDRRKKKAKKAKRIARKKTLAAVMARRNQSKK